MLPRPAGAAHQKARPRLRQPIADPLGVGHRIDGDDVRRSRQITRGLRIRIGDQRRGYARVRRELHFELGVGGVHPHRQPSAHEQAHGFKCPAVVADHRDVLWPRQHGRSTAGCVASGRTPPARFARGAVVPLTLRETVQTGSGLVGHGREMLPIPGLIQPAALTVTSTIIPPIRPRLTR